MAGNYEQSAGYAIPEGKDFYFKKIGESKVLEIRKVLNFGSGTKYLIDRSKNNFGYVSMHEFYYVPHGYEMYRID